MEKGKGLSERCEKEGEGASPMAKVGSEGDLVKKEDLKKGREVEEKLVKEDLKGGKEEEEKSVKEEDLKRGKEEEEKSVVNEDLKRGKEEEEKLVKKEDLKRGREEEEEEEKSVVNEFKKRKGERWVPPDIELKTLQERWGMGVSTTETQAYGTADGGLKISMCRPIPMTEETKAPESAFKSSKDYIPRSISKEHKAKIAANWRKLRASQMFDADIMDPDVPYCGPRLMRPEFLTRHMEELLSYSNTAIDFYNSQHGTKLKAVQVVKNVSALAGIYEDYYITFEAKESESESESLYQAKIIRNCQLKSLDVKLVRPAPAPHTSS